MQDFKDKVIAVTGGASGIGFAIAQEAARLGMRVVVNDQDEAYLAACAARLEEMGADFRLFEADMSLPESAQALFDFVMEAYGQADMLVNNAGVAVVGPLWEIPEQDIRWITEVNFLGHLYSSRLFIPQMIRQGTPACIVNVASTAGLMTSGNGIMYHATKFADVGASEALALSLKARDIRNISVHCLLPAFVQTQIHESERYRPERYRDLSDPYYSGEEFKSGYRRAAKQVNAGMPIDYVGKCVFNAVREERFYVFTHPESIVVAGKRVKNMAEGNNPV